MIFESLEPETVNEIIVEIKNLQVAVIESNHVPKFFGVWKGKAGKHYHLIFEFIEGLPLRDIMGSLTLEEKLSILYQTCDIINVLHKRKLYHRDIKPENIMVNPETKNIKLIDFGTAKLATKTVTFTAKAVGTTFYMAPDFFDFDENEDNDKPISNSYKVDIWSIGCMMSEMLSGVYPWHNVTKLESKVEACLIKKTPFPIPKEITDKFPEYKEIIQNCLKISSEDRCSTDEIMKFLATKIKIV